MIKMGQTAATLAFGHDPDKLIIYDASEIELIRKDILRLRGLDVPESAIVRITDWLTEMTNWTPRADP
jgi:hypothetical protein